MMIAREIHKCFRKPYAVLALVLLLCLAMYLQVGRFAQVTTRDAALSRMDRVRHREYAELLDGKSPEEAIFVLQEHKQSLMDRAEAKTLTFTDESGRVRSIQEETQYLATFLFPRVYEASAYEGRTRSIIDGARKNEDSFYEGSVYDLDFVAEAYDRRMIDTFYFGRDLEVVFLNRFPTLAAMLTMLYLIAPSFPREREEGISGMLVGGKMKRRLFRAKILSTPILAFVITLLFFTCSWMTARYFVGGASLSAPIFSLPSYYETPLNWTIGLMALAHFGSMWLGLSVYGFLLLAIGTYYRKSFPATVGAVALTALFVYIDERYPSPFSPLGMFRLANDLRFYDGRWRLGGGRMILLVQTSVLFFLLIFLKRRVRRWS